MATELDCLAGSLNVTWQQSSDAQGYVATVTSSTGHTALCNTTEPHCLATDLQCGMNYNVTVRAYDETCNSSSSAVQHVATGNAPIHSGCIGFSSVFDPVCEAI